VPPPHHQLLLVVVVEELLVVVVELLLVVVVEPPPPPPPQVKLTDPVPHQFVYQLLLGTDTEALPVFLLQPSTITTM